MRHLISPAQARDNRSKIMEVISILTAAKEMGFEVGHIVSLLVMYFLLKKDLLKVFDKQFEKLIEAIKSLEKVHNERLEKIEAHVGLNKNKGV